jgi:hypothetical protein
VLDVLRGIRPNNHLTVLHDIVISVPEVTRSVVDEFAWDTSCPVATAARSAAANVHADVVLERR